LTTNLLWTARSEELRSWFHENLLMTNATKISRHAVYKVEIEAPRRSSDSTDSN